MIGLLQRVSRAEVRVDDAVIARIDRGVLVFVGIERDDDSTRAARLAERLLTYRVFPDGAGKMNRDVLAVRGGVLLVPQFTLAADTSAGTRASFAAGADPAVARALYEHLVSVIRQRLPEAQSGRFGADMQVTLTNEGPVTFNLRA
jgi:D-tyrosyl-tRNA(Tyr) deacylase